MKRELTNVAIEATLLARINRLADSIERTVGFRPSGSRVACMLIETALPSKEAMYGQAPREGKSK